MGMVLDALETLVDWFERACERLQRAWRKLWVPERRRRE
jgi:hypothetical protein